MFHRHNHAMEALMTTSNTLALTVRGMHCDSCAALIDDTLTDVPGVITSTTSSETERSTITHDERTTHADIVAAIEALGYHAEPSTTG
jgi:Cu+-exporting ATPase